MIFVGFQYIIRYAAVGDDHINFGKIAYFLYGCFLKLGVITYKNSGFGCIVSLFHRIFLTDSSGPGAAPCNDFFVDENVIAAISRAEFSLPELEFFP